MSDIITKQKIDNYIAIRKVLDSKKIWFDDWLNMVSPHLDWSPKHLVYMRRNGLDQILEGKPLKIMYFLPVQHGKSTQNSIHFPAFYIEKNQTHNVVLAANTQVFANKFSRHIKKLLGDTVILAKDRKGSEEWELKAGGSFTCGGIGIGTGLPIDLCVIDDPIKTPEQAQSKTYRDWAWEWWSYSIAPRIREKTSVLFTMTRWHQDDLAGRILQTEGDDWIVINMPGIHDDPSFKDPIGREIGEALWPDQYSVEKLLKFKKQYPGMFESLIQQRPSAKEGTIFKRSYFQYYREKPNFKMTVQSIDMANKKGALNDYTVCTTWGIDDKGYYLLNVFRKKVNFPEAKKALIDLYNKFRPNLVLIEDAANGQALIQDLKVSTRIPVKAIRPTGSKEARAEAASATFEAGKIFFPDNAEWLSDYTEELTMFPTFGHDDQVDSTTQFINKMNGSMGRKISFSVI